MARKKPAGPKKQPKPKKPARPAKAPATPSLSVFSGPDAGEDGDYRELDTYDVDFFLDIFEQEDCEIQMIENSLFFAGTDDGFKIIVEVSERLPFVTLKFPLKSKSGVSKAKAMSWINQCMIDFPMLRIFRTDDAILFSTFDYPYDTTMDFDVDHFMMSVKLFWSLNLMLIEEASEAVLDMDWMPEFED